MNPALTQSLLALLALVSIASIVNSNLYCVFRLVEKKSQGYSLLLNFVVFALCVFLTPSGVDRMLTVNFVDFLFIALVSALGGVLHIKSGGASRVFFLAFLMMFLISFSGLLVTSHVIQLFNLKGFPFPLDQNARLALRTLITIQVLAPPLLIWMLINSKLRPGIDKPFDEEDKARNSNSHQV